MASRVSLKTKGQEQQRQGSQKVWKKVSITFCKGLRYGTGNEMNSGYSESKVLRAEKDFRLLYQAVNHSLVLVRVISNNMAILCIRAGEMVNQEKESGQLIEGTGLQEHQRIIPKEYPEWVD
ncbi:hypothetical protein D5086_032522 [Populus alba]|uniref:Uncharacterized protein n=1 Tax=Populus alba TaxID=43335 RepID=A0ACC4ALL6_POPAL